jgi:hypothetical protein
MSASDEDFDKAIAKLQKENPGANVYRRGDQIMVDTPLTPEEWYSFITFQELKKQFSSDLELALERAGDEGIGPDPEIVYPEGL